MLANALRELKDEQSTLRTTIFKVSASSTRSRKTRESPLGIIKPKTISTSYFLHRQSGRTFPSTGRNAGFRVSRRERILWTLLAQEDRGNPSCHRNPASRCHAIDTSIKGNLRRAPLLLRLRQRFEHGCAGLLRATIFPTIRKVVPSGETAQNFKRCKRLIFRLKPLPKCL